MKGRTDDETRASYSVTGLGRRTERFAWGFAVPFELPLMRDRYPRAIERATGRVLATGDKAMSRIGPKPAPRQIADIDETAVYDARELISNGVKASIILDDQTYTLRITRAGNLILTK